MLPKNIVEGKKYQFEIENVKEMSTGDRVNVIQFKKYFKTIKLFGRKIPIKKLYEVGQGMLLWRDNLPDGKKGKWHNLYHTNNNVLSIGSKTKNAQLLKFLKDKLG